MSYVTTVLFASADYRARDRFEAIVRDGYTRYGTPYDIKPTEQDGPKYGPGEVYYHGFNYADQPMLDLLRAEPWPPDTVLWIYCEGFQGPEIRVGDKLILDAEPDRW